MTVLAATVTALTATPNPSRPGQRVTFTATATVHGEPITTGTVTFRDGGKTLAADVAVDENGEATFTTAILADGTHRVTAAYKPDAGFAPGASRTRSPRSSTATARRRTRRPHRPPTLPAGAADAVTVTWNWNDHGVGVEPAHCRNRSTADREGRPPSIRGMP